MESTFRQLKALMQAWFARLSAALQVWVRWLPMHAGSPCLLGLPTDAEFCHARQGAPPGTLQVTGVLGLAFFLAGFFHIRGSGAIFITQSPPPPSPGETLSPS